jgi:acetyltransferase-like isoleucine patch superfamily enzyme
MKRFLAEMANSGLDAVGRTAGVAVAGLTKRGLVHFPFVSQFLAQLPFSMGWKLRRAVYSGILPSVGKGAVLHQYVVIEDERSTIGDDVWISAGCYLDFVRIEDHVLIGPGAVLLSGGRQHRFDRLDVPIKQQGNNQKEPLLIGAGAWIGANATVMADVGEGAIVGAGAVVTRPVPPRAIVAGNPARVIRTRGQLASAGTRP